MGTHRLLGLLSAACLLLTLAGCGGEPEASSEPAPTTTTTTTTAVTTTTTTTAPLLGINAFTGIRDMKTDANRPIGFVVSDETSSLTQLGVESADFFFEAETEAGIPRILAIYASVDRIPEAIGPVRSARPHFVKIAAALNVIYCHIGGSSSGLQAIRDLGVKEITEAFVIHPVLKNSANFSWNRSAFTAEKVRNDIRRRGLPTKGAPTSPFQFGNKAGTQPATTVDVQISETYDMAFTYDTASGKYQKHRNSLDTPVHKTYTGGPIAVENVIVMFDRRTIDRVEQKADGGTMTRYNFDLKTGHGLLATGGTARSIRWQCSKTGLQFFESDGTTPLTVATGKTYLCLTSQTLENKTNVY